MEAVLVGVRGDLEAAQRDNSELAEQLAAANAAHASDAETVRSTSQGNTLQECPHMSCLGDAEKLCGSGVSGSPLTPLRGKATRCLLTKCMHVRVVEPHALNGTCTAG